MKRLAVIVMIATACASMVFVLGCASGSASYVPSIDRKDQALEDLVRERIQMDSTARRAMVNVEVEYGFATIYGNERDPAVLARIVSIIRNTPGIKGVEKGY